MPVPLAGVIAYSRLPQHAVLKMAGMAGAGYVGTIMSLDTGGSNRGQRPQYVTHARNRSHGLYLGFVLPATPVSPPVRPSNTHTHRSTVSKSPFDLFHRCKITVD